MIHTQQRGQKPLKGEVSSKRPHFTHSLRVKPQSHSLCSEAALTTHHHFVFPDPEGLSTHKQFYCFSRPSASRKVNLEHHAGALSATLLAALGPCSFVLPSLPTLRYHSTAQCSKNAGQSAFIQFAYLPQCFSSLGHCNMFNEVCKLASFPSLSN